MRRVVLNVTNLVHFAGRNGRYEMNVDILTEFKRRCRNNGISATFQWFLRFVDDVVSGVKDIGDTPTELREFHLDYENPSSIENWDYREVIYTVGELRDFLEDMPRDTPLFFISRPTHLIDSVSFVHRAVAAVGSVPLSEIAPQQRAGVCSPHAALMTLTEFPVRREFLNNEVDVDVVVGDIVFVDESRCNDVTLL